MLMVRFGNGVVMNTPLSNVIPQNNQGIPRSYHSMENIRISPNYGVNPLGNRIKARAKINPQSNAEAKSKIEKQIEDLKKNKMVLDTILSRYFEKKDADIINIPNLAVKFDNEISNLCALNEEDNKFCSIINGISNSSSQEKKSLVQEIDKQQNDDPSQKILEFINNHKDEFISKMS